ncbi:MAG: hypothetical protein QM751_10720 [Paludibacteraceae bacterium]
MIKKTDKLVSPADKIEKPDWFEQNFVPVVVETAREPDAQLFVKYCTGESFIWMC